MREVFCPGSVAATVLAHEFLVVPAPVPLSMRRRGADAPDADVELEPSLVVTCRERTGSRRGWLTSRLLPGSRPFTWSTAASNALTSWLVLTGSTRGVAG